jgi:hypothetical protein
MSAGAAAASSCCAAGLCAPVCLGAGFVAVQLCSSVGAFFGWFLEGFLVGEGFGWEVPVVF